ncbi:MAG: ComF family protein [Erysipelotrichaceae bacterium]|nr:ComF family protein [Erysipelotrichaceae bacterium]
MKCLYCDSRIDKITLKSLFFKEDPLCRECRKALKTEHKTIRINEIEVSTFFDYDSLFRSVLLQYKECCDEALKDVFLYDLAFMIYLRYLGYEIVLIPSSELKKEKRGFDHLKLIFESTGLKMNDGLKMKKQLIQEGASAEERKRMTDNYVYEGKPLRKALIVDDVMTTGSSLYGAYQALKPYAGKIKVLSLARVHDFTNQEASVL